MSYTPLAERMPGITWLDRLKLIGTSMQTVEDNDGFYKTKFSYKVRKGICYVLQEERAKI